jgi:hypothetical protein
MAETALNIITSAMRKAGILTKNESPSSDEANDGLEMLNDLLASNANDGLFVYARTLENFTLSGGVSDYTIGIGGTFNTERPVYIASAYVRIGTIDYPLQVITDTDYADIDIKSLGSIPYWINYTYGYPLGTLKLYPVPSAGWSLYLLSEKQISEFTLNQTVSLPPGWARYLKNQLAIELAPEYGQQVPAETVEIASKAMAAIKRGVARTRSMDNPMNDGGRRNVYTGWEH